MKKTALVFIIAILILSLLLVGCDNNSGNETVSSNTNTEMTRQNGQLQANGTNGIMGRVSAVDGNKITVEVLSNQNNQGEAPDGQKTAPGMPDGINTQGNPPEAVSGDVSMQVGGIEQGNPPEIPSGNANGMNQGEASTGNLGDAPNGNTIPAQPVESKTVTIDDISILYKTQNNSELQASLSDITVGTMLNITYGESSEIVKIVIDSGNSFGGN